jgi:hypothetical protein
MQGLQLGQGQGVIEIRGRNSRLIHLFVFTLIGKWTASPAF